MKNIKTENTIKLVRCRKKNIEPETFYTHVYYTNAFYRGYRYGRLFCFYKIYPNSLTAPTKQSFFHGTFTYESILTPTKFLTCLSSRSAFDGTLMNIPFAICLAEML